MTASSAAHLANASKLYIVPTPLTIAADGSDAATVINGAIVAADSSTPAVAQEFTNLREIDPISNPANIVVTQNYGEEHVRKYLGMVDSGEWNAACDLIETGDNAQSVIFMDEGTFKQPRRGFIIRTLDDFSSTANGSLTYFTGRVSDVTRDVSTIDETAMLRWTVARDSLSITVPVS